MVSVLRTLQAEWNALVPQAQELNIRRVRRLNDPLETIEYRRTKLEWLRGEIERLSHVRPVAMATTSLTPVQDDFDLDAFTFGVELEFLLPIGVNHGIMAERIRRHANVDCQSEGYNHATGPHWKIVTDGSLGDYTRGAECVSPVLRGANGFAQVKRVCDVLKQEGCKVSLKCGLHVHVGAREFGVETTKRLVRLYASAENAIDGFMAPSRRGANGGRGFCKSIRLNQAQMTRADSMDTIAVAIGQNAGRHNTRNGGRYCKLNLQSFWQHGTVEFRHHQGTVEADKTVNWVKMCLRMCAAAQAGAFEATTLDALLDVTRSSVAERQFFKGRAAFFAGQVARNEQRNARALNRMAGRDVRQIVRDDGTVFTEAGADLQQRAVTRNQY